MDIRGVFHCSTLLRLTLYIVWGQNMDIRGVFHCSIHSQCVLRLTLYIVRSPRATGVPPCTAHPHIL